MSEKGTSKKTRSEAKWPKKFSPELIQENEEFGSPWFKAGALVVDKFGMYVLVKERKVKQRQPDGSVEWVVSDKGKWNLPCGRLQPWEDLETATRREVNEESGYDVQIGNDICFIGIRHDIDNQYMIVIYATAVQGMQHEFNTEEIAAVKAFTHNQIKELFNAGQLRNPEMTMEAVNNWEMCKTIPKDAIHTFASKYEAD